MAKADALMLDAGGRELRVSSPDRVIFPATERTDGADQARRRQVLPRGRTTASCGRSSGAPPRSSAGPRACTRGSSSPRARRAAATPSSRSGSRAARRTTWRPRGSTFPSGRYADEICPTEIAVVGWAAQMGTITFHPWPVRSDDVDHPDELRLDLDPQPGTDFADAARVAAEARVLLGGARLHRLPQDLRRPRHPHLRADRAALDLHRRSPRRDRVRARARAAHAGPGDHQVVEGGARRAHLRRLQPERARPHHRLGLQRPARSRARRSRRRSRGTS